MRRAGHPSPRRPTPPAWPAALVANRPHPDGSWRDVPLTSGERQLVAPHSSHVPHARGTTSGWTTPRPSPLEHGSAPLGVLCAGARTASLWLAPDPATPGSRPRDHGHNPRHEVEEKHTPVCSPPGGSHDDRGTARRPNSTLQDGSVAGNGLAAASCFAPSLGLRENCRLPISASSTAAELASINPAANQLADFLPQSAAVMCDSRAALLTLARAERGALVAQRLARKFVVIVPSGCDVVFQCEPSHVGTTCKRDSGRPRQEGSPPQHTRLSVHPRGRCCDLRIARQVRALHPHSRVATGNPPRPLPKTGISRHARAFLLWLRTECFRTAERRFRFTNSGSPSCAKCLAVETTEHILLECPGYIEQRQRLFDAYERLGLQYVSLDHLRFPQAHRSRLMRAFEAPLEFFGDADLITCL
ncbi:hypothetical protein MRX96_029012 [Rhipicephalus microplus]